MNLRNFSTSVAILFTSASLAQAAYVPTRQDSGWVRVFNGKDLTGLFPHVEGGKWGENPGNVVTVHDSMIHFYQGRKRSLGHVAPHGVLSTETEFSYYQSRIEYRRGDIKDDGWINHDPYNSGFFYHAKPGGPVWPPSIECQLKVHWNSKTNTPCTAAAGDCNELWAGDFWLLSGVEITKNGNKGGHIPASHTPDRELEGWNKMEIRVWSDSLFQNHLNGVQVNHGEKSTWLNPQGQRVPLTEGRIQLELEGSEFMYRNWEIRLLKKDPLYTKWYVEGCKDPSYKEYSATANLHVAGLCVNLAPAGIEKSFGSGPPNRQGYRLVLRDDGLGFEGFGKRVKVNGQPLK